MEPDFSGYATKAGLKCTDGLTITAEAFKHQDKVQVPLVWQHGHNDAENVLGHAILEARNDGMYVKCYFNDTDKAKHAKKAVQHKDINQLSIWANQVVQKAKMVLHGMIKEVSLVLGGANPGALIDFITVQHSDGTTEDMNDEIVVYTGLTFDHADGAPVPNNDDQGNGNLDDESVNAIIEQMTEEQQNVVHYVISEAIKAGRAGTVQHSDKKGGKEVKHHNVFDRSDEGTAEGKLERTIVSHDDMKGIVASAMKGGSLKKAVEEYAIQHGVENIESLFPEAKLLEGGAPSFVSRDMAWVAKVFDAAKKSPFAKVKTRTADITFEEARAKGYIKGNVKRDEFFTVAFRETGPQTVYKKQAIDRDDTIDITDFDIVAWIKAEMRVMLKEEIARAILVGDGRDITDEDKIREDKIRPILTDDPFYTVRVNFALAADDSNLEDMLDSIILNRQYYKGSNPTLFTTSSLLAKWLLLRDGQGRKLYRGVAELKSDLMVDDIVTVEILDSYPQVGYIMVNMDDYNVGADRGGETTLFDDFDIDYNKWKYLLETRCSGALTKPRTALVGMLTADGDAAATAAAPSWDAETYTVTIPVNANVDYVNAETGAALADGPIVLAAGDVLTVRAVAVAGKYLTNTKVEWSYLRPTGS